MRYKKPKKKEIEATIEFYKKYYSNQAKTFNLEVERK